MTNLTSYLREHAAVDKSKTKPPADCSTDGQRLSLPDVASAEDLAKLAWAIAHPARVRIVRLLLSRTACVCGEIVDEMPLAQSTVSQHLKILKQSGLVQGEIDGPRVCYCINQQALQSLKTLVADL
jgi:ArsR family transcriptional regulator, arsenate/arsenite/antimonite-responsive transcriptional repressor